MIRAAIFDIDGTLVDSNDFHARAWREAFQHFGKNVPYDEVRRQIGKGGDQLMPVFFSPEELERLGHEIEEYRSRLFTEKYLPRVRPFPKVQELFERLRSDGLRIALASSAKEEELKHHKKTLEIEDLVEAAASASDAKKSKPHPDIFVAALQDLGEVSPQQVIVVGDTPYDIEAAAKAGMGTIALLSGGFPEEELRLAGAIGIYKDIAELLEKYQESPFGQKAEL